MEVPMGLTPIEIENRTFDRRMRGYSRRQVREFLSLLGEEAARLNVERNLLEEQVNDLRCQIEEYRDREKGVGETLKAMRELSEKMKEDARREGELIVREARLKADEILEYARAEAVRLEVQISQIRVERDTFEDRLRLLIDEHQRLLIQRRQVDDWREPVRLTRKR